MDTAQPSQLNVTPIKLILSMEGLSSLVNQFFQILLPWYILTSTGSIAWMGVAAFATIMPGIFSALWGGTIIDRFGRAKTMLICEAGQFILIATIPVLIITDKAYPALISFVIFLIAFFDIPGQLARQSLMPLYSRWAGIPLHKTTGYKEAIDGIMAVAGPIAGGIIIALYGTLEAWLCASLMCFAIVILALSVFNKRKPRVQIKQTNYSHAWRNMRDDKFLMQVILFTLPLFILGESWELLILPAYVHTFNHTSVFLGILEAAFGLGAFMGAVYFAAAGKRFKFFTLLTLNYTAYAVSVMVLMYNLPKIPVILTSMISGIPFGAFGAMVTTILLSRTAEEIRAKTLGLFAASAAFIESFFILIIGFLLQTKGLFFTLSLTVILFVVLIIISLSARKYEDTPPINAQTLKDASKIK